MQHTPAERAERSVHHVHELIHAVFTGPATDTTQQLDELLAAFAEDFSMVGTAGKVVDRAQVEQLFRGIAGTRCGLEIVVDEVRVVWQAGANVALRYRETHRLAGQQTRRWSLAIIECTGTGVMWHCLQETPIGD
ncbi:MULTISPECIES: DUF4440 domain-containing protein [unclassified Pseudomonas]|uniref:DUF4440 domain-containing protein n=1 Tax=unclassified Pseudomonas TaxID=196821 RepID=UPI00244900BB|nr:MULTISPECIES: DUF4440 domain-containing protein [unclassified Pseudomonas]MDH0300949.1 DUF4440 domain-containing protein [Pseudomonas sp. GD04091]MDH1983519.1 DUF4440 domain-containing protein [Pseudomonas sp. GD03689]